MTLHKGEIVNQRYRVLSQMGEGGFGAVYKVEDLSLKTICALKENLDYWDEAQKQFEREAHMLAVLRHINLPRVIDYFVAPGQGQYLVMDFIEGYDLQQVIERTGKPLYEKQTLVWIEQTCNALAYLHTQNPPIVHRDVKPANIRVTPGGAAILVDFGVAKFYRPGDKTSLGARAVTPGYSPIEQYGEATTDTRADIYSLGATMYTLLTGRRPPESIDRVSGKGLDEPRQLNPEISPAVERVILRAMEIVADNRFSSITEMRHSLSQTTLMRQPASVPAGKPLSQPQAGPNTHSVGLSAPASGPVSRSVVVKPAPASFKTAAAMDWVCIPAGEFLFGVEKCKIDLPAFDIARYPVTNQQYALFLKANQAVAAPPHWKGREFPLGKGRHPVVGVCYHEAQSFCRWLGCRLPTAQQWEKAARGTDGRSYPWGESWVDGKYCNTWNTHNQGSAPVDKYPAGASPYGVQDMVGNAWEWTATEYNGPFLHELRGGSWKSFSGLVAAVTQQDWLTLDDRRDDVGFRCVRFPSE